MKSRLLIFATAFLGMATFAQAQEFNLEYKPTKGEKLVFVLKFDILGLGQSIVYKATITNEVVEAQEDGSYLVASYQTDSVVLVEGVEQPTFAGTVTSVTTYEKSGRPTKIGGDEATPESLRVANVTSFIGAGKAVKLGDEWDVAILGDKDAGTVDVKHRYNVVRVEGDRVVVECVVTESSGDNPASATGAFTIDAKTGRAILYVAEVTNLPIGPQLVSGKIEIALKTT